MTGGSGPPFADTLYWVALVNKRDQYHQRAKGWSAHITGTILTTEAVLIETASSLAKPPHRAAWLILLELIRVEPRYRVVPFSGPLLDRAWARYADRPDKAWSLTDCVSFLVMEDERLSDALTADDHFRRAGFVPLLQSDPPEAPA